MRQPDKQQPVPQIRVNLKLYIDESSGETSFKHYNWVYRPFHEKNLLSLLPGRSFKTNLIFMNLLRHWLNNAAWWKILLSLCSVSPLQSQSSEIDFLVMIARGWFELTRAPTPSGLIELTLHIGSAWLRMKLLVDLNACCLNFLWCLLTMAQPF